MLIYGGIEMIESLPGKNTTSYACENVSCHCIPGRLLCGEGGSVDLTEWFTSEEGPKGPSNFACEETYSVGNSRPCSFSG